MTFSGLTVIFLNTSWNWPEWLTAGSILITVLFAIVKFSYNSGVIANTLAEMKPAIDEIPEMKQKVNIMWGRFDELMDSKFALQNSPRYLNQEGYRILEESGVDYIVNDKKNFIITKVKSQQPKNAYQGEESIIGTVKKLPVYFPELLDILQSRAYKAGVHVNDLLFIGGMNIRDEILGKLKLLPAGKKRYTTRLK